ncbi:ABC transporter ATP-binding protein [Chryseobacterium shigense]|uniref:ATP-binding cassette, subfamily B n=1 Tax=Chryseobacterium shigense TaxID=297244 RepID=A0A1N7IP66_9FLAO|nr:peptidase domain-containing ABC transporter [Chryseobacterium shigense]PQA95701.1 ABC transporter ATP-binding protein [Chryseobacterium shigense]SIS38761.1 ATP-binding cassette, subfamily B [Chryseobacterium shigense]
MFNFVFQRDQMDCGPACLEMICNHYGKSFGIHYLREKCFVNREGVSLSGIREASENLGFEVTTGKLTTDSFEHNMFPCILHWNQDHFIVLYKISKNYFNKKKIYKIADPAHGLLSLSEEKFKDAWLSDGEKGIAVFFEPTEKFYLQNAHEEKSSSLKDMIRYVKPYRRQLLYMFLFLLLGTISTLAFPILTQKLIDDGVDKKNVNVIFFVLVAQLFLFIGNMVFSVFRNFIALNIGTKINIDVISDFLMKFVKLPIKFFDTKLLGDFNQRIQDHERIEQFFTSNSLTTLFSLITFSVFFGILWYYNITILFVYLLLTVLSILWSLFWMKKRKALDYFRFRQKSENQEAIYEILNGISEMKLNQYESFKISEWKKIQKKLFKINVRILKLDQVQLSGFDFINQLKNIIVTFLAANFVIKGNMTIGELLSVSYIIGQMNSPINQIITFFRSLQDARLSLDRLDEVQNHKEEESTNQKKLSIGNDVEEKGITLKKVYFQYEGSDSDYILKDVSVEIPEGKITAIVGASGSGKTTLLKILLKFYDPLSGEIIINNDDLNGISPKALRENCGVVMQDGYIFSDTIERNIATSDDIINFEKLQYAMHVANILDFVKKLPLKTKTRIGISGIGLSGGQKQRILIARAIYKNPHYLFFDEATSALDAENEKVIHNNLQEFFKGKTAIIIAHRLSTVKSADQIIVLKNGEIVERGNHDQLVDNKADYFNLIKNQLELGN